MALYGRNIRKECSQLYSAYQRGCRGVSSRDLSLARYQAAIVLALFEVRQAKPNEFVFLLVPKAHEPWALVKLGTLAGEAFRLRKGDLASVKAVRDAFARLKLGAKPFHLRPDARWVSFAFSKEDPIPTWMSEKLEQVE